MSLSKTASAITERVDAFGDAIRTSRNLEEELPELLTSLSEDLMKVPSSHEEFMEALELLVDRAPDMKLRSAIGKFIENINSSEKRPNLMRLARQTLATS
ncbi:MAG: hypothetical protein AAB652_00515 [Patescibacteria group bacterium]